MVALVVLTTVGTEEQAHLLAEEVVARRHAGCVNIIPGVRSIYRWQGKICRDGEFLLVMKTLASEYDALAATIKELHGYELPEILALPVERGDRAFLDWIAAALDKEAEFSDDGDEDLPFPLDDPAH